jgi:hypothetical protein
VQCRLLIHVGRVEGGALGTQHFNDAHLTGI